MPPRARANTAGGNTAPSDPPADPRPQQALNRVPTLADLRAPFAAEQIGKLPRITCRDCSNASSRVCDRHQKSRCDGCRNYITQQHIHLDYVGHAAVTDRLLHVDPEYTWEPVAFDANGLPMLDASKGLWIKLTVLGVTRFGYGTSERNDSDSVKILIGDALRNAAMRFGVALDLWSKEDLDASGDSSERSEASVSQDRAAETPPAPSGRNWLEEAKRCTTEQAIIDLGKACHDAGEFNGQVKDTFVRRRAELHAKEQPAAPPEGQ